MNNKKNEGYLNKTIENKNRGPGLQTQQQKYSNENIAIQKRSVKFDLKLEYLVNEVNSANKFKEFLQELNQSTKTLIKNNFKSQSTSDDSPKKKNSFTVPNHSYQKQNIQDPINSDKNTQTEKEFKTQSRQIIRNYQKKLNAIDFSGLRKLKGVIQARNSNICSHVNMIKKKITNSYIWDDKYFYDFTELNYQEKMLEMEKRLQISESNLQGKEKQKKSLGIHPQTLSISLPAIVKYSYYDQGSKQNQIMQNNIETKRKIMQQLKKINQLYTKFENAFQTKITPNFNSEEITPNFNSEEVAQSMSDDKSNSNPIVESALKIKDQLNKILQKLLTKDHTIKKTSSAIYCPSLKKQKQKFTSILNFLNKEILQNELYKTKAQILKLKHQTHSLETAITQLQAFKALTLLRNKYNLQKHSSLSQKRNKKDQLTFKDEILRLILQHQFLNKILQMQTETKFTNITKKNVVSATDIQLNAKINYFPHNKKVRQYHSQTKIKDQLKLNFHCQKSFLKKQNKKSVKLQLTSPKTPKKQIVPSADTNF